MKDCIFCKIISGEIPSKKVYEDERVCAFWDVNPVAPVHILVIPKKHIPAIRDISIEDESLIGHIHSVINKVAGELDIADDGYRIVNNCGEMAGQTVFHIHFHLIGGKQLDWPS